MNKAEISRIINDNSTKHGKVFDFFIQFLIILSLITYAISTEPNLSATAIKYLHLCEIIIVIIFTIEYILRIYVAENKWKYIFSFFGLIDLIAILPFYLALHIDMRSIRVLRIFRIFRAFKLTRYSRAIGRLALAYNIAKEEIILFLLVSLILLYLSAAGIHFFEYQAQPDKFTSLFTSLWWAVGTLTTVGYGDIYPITLGGKIFTFFILLVGIGIVAVPAALLADGLSQARRIEKSENKELDDKEHHKEI